MRKTYLGLAAVAVVAYAGWTAVVAHTYQTNQNARRAALRRIVELGEKNAEQMLRHDGLPALSEACAGKLEAGSPVALVNYTAQYSSGEDDKVGAHLAGLCENHDVKPDSFERFTDETDWTRHIGGDLSLAGEWVSSLHPNGWGYRRDPGCRGRPELRFLKYLLVTEPRVVSWPEEQVDVYVPGLAALHTRVLRWPGGEVVCEGVSAATASGTITMEGRGKTKVDAQFEAARRVSFHVEAYFISAMHFRPLFELCAPFGKVLCEKAGHRAGPTVKR